MTDTEPAFDDPTPHARHRPWPMPDGPWIMGQRWTDLLFAHWQVSHAALRAIVPAALPLDERDGAAWVTIAPFRITKLHARGVPPLPGLSGFPELNVRTYVTIGGKPGVYFFSLDAGHALAVAFARQMYHLPYFKAEMRAERTPNGSIRYESRRTHDAAPPAEFDATYRATGRVAPAEAGSVDHWLVERYCLYAIGSSGDVYRAEIHHQPWPLQLVEVELGRNTMAAAAGIELGGAPQRTSFAERLDVVIWPPHRVETD